MIMAIVEESKSLDIWLFIATIDGCFSDLNELQWTW